MRVFGSGPCDEVLAVRIVNVPELRALQRADPLRPRRRCRDAPFAMTTVRRACTSRLPRLAASQKEP